MATLTAIVAKNNGVVMAPVAAAGGGDQFVNTGREVVYIKNGGGASINLTITPAGLPGGLALAPVVVAVAAAAEKIVGPFDAGLFNNGGGFVPLTYSAVTSVVVAVIKIP